MSKLAGFGAHAVVRDGDEFTIDVNHVRVVTASSFYPIPDLPPDRISLGGVAGYAVTQHLKDPVTELNHCRVVTARLDKYPLNCKLSLMENFHLMVMGNWNSVEELLSPESYVVAEITDIAPGVVAGADTKVLLEFTDAAPGIGDMEFYYDRAAVGTVGIAVEINIGDPDNAIVNLRRQIPLFTEIEFTVDVNDLTLTVTEDNLLFRAGSVFTLTNATTVNQPPPPPHLIDSIQTDPYARAVLGLRPIRYWPVLAEEISTVHDFAGGHYHGAFENYINTSETEPVRKYQGIARGFSIHTGNRSQVIVPAHTAVNTLLNPSAYGGTVTLWMRRVINNDQNGIIRVPRGGNSSRSAWRIYRNSAETPDDQNRTTYNYQTNVNYFIAWKYDPMSNMMVLFVNGEYKTAVRNTSTSDGGPLYFPAFMSWNHYGIRGIVSDVALYDRALTDTQIETLYNIGRLD